MRRLPGRRDRFRELVQTFTARQHAVPWPPTSSGHGGIVTVCARLSYGCTVSPRTPTWAPSAPRSPAGDRVQGKGWEEVTKLGRCAVAASGPSTAGVAGGDEDTRRAGGRWRGDAGGRRLRRRGGAPRRNRPRQLLAPRLAASRTQRKSMSAAQAPGPRRLLTAAGAERPGSSVTDGALTPTPRPRATRREEQNATRPPSPARGLASREGPFQTPAPGASPPSACSCGWPACGQGARPAVGQRPGRGVPRAAVWGAARGALVLSEVTHLAPCSLLTRPCSRRRCPPHTLTHTLTHTRSRTLKPEHPGSRGRTLSGHAPRAAWPHTVAAAVAAKGCV